MKYGQRFFIAKAISIFVVMMSVFAGQSAFADGEAQKIFLRSSSGGKLFLLVPQGGEQKDSLLMLQLFGDSYARGYQHGVLLADNIADVISNRYNCIVPEILSWTEDAYHKMTREFQNEIRGIANGVASKGYNLPFAKIILHVTQPLVGLNFPWFVCPWNEGSGPMGSFSYAVWGRYTLTGTALAINSPDFGSVPKSLARNRVLVSVRPSSGFRYAYLGVAGVIGMAGVNETGLSIAGTAGQFGVTIKTPMPGNGVSVPDGFMTLFMIGAYVLRDFSGFDPFVFDKFENEVLRVNPIDRFILQLTTPTSSALWESGAAVSLDYPRIARRMAGEWDAGTITPVDWRGDFVLLPDSVLRISALPFPVTVDMSDASGEVYDGRAWPGGTEIHWRRMQLGRAFGFPGDLKRGARFADWFANLGAMPADAPDVIRGDGRLPDSIVSVLPDKTGGFWVTVAGDAFGSWRRENQNAFHAYNSDGAEICTGPLYDFGNGVTGWCQLNVDTDIEWVAWTHQYPDGAFERLDASNISVLPQIKPWLHMGFPLFDGPHTRTHFFLRELGVPQGALTLDEFFRVFQRAYFSVGSEDQPFGVGAYNLTSGDALFTVSRYEGDRYIGGLNQAQKPIKLNRYQLFGW